MCSRPFSCPCNSTAPYNDGSVATINLRCSSKCTRIVSSASADLMASNASFLSGVQSNFVSCFRNSLSGPARVANSRMKSKYYCVVQIHDSSDCLSFGAGAASIAEALLGFGSTPCSSTTWPRCSICFSKNRHLSRRRQMPARRIRYNTCHRLSRCSSTIDPVTTISSRYACVFDTGTNTCSD